MFAMVFNGNIKKSSCSRRSCSYPALLPALVAVEADYVSFCGTLRFKRGRAVAQPFMKTSKLPAGLGNTQRDAVAGNFIWKPDHRRGPLFPFGKLATRLGRCSRAKVKMTNTKGKKKKGKIVNCVRYCSQLSHVLLERTASG